MPFAFLIVGVVMVISGVRGTSQDLLTLLKGDLTGKNNYFYWIIAILILGSLGYISAFRSFSRAFLVLVLIVLILSNGGFFQLFNKSIATISGSTTSGI